MGTSATRRYNGLDWLRVIFTAFVVGMHLNLISLFSPGDGVCWLDVVGSDLFCLAVPGFLIISFFLQIIVKEDAAAFRKRLWRLSALYVFWVSLWTAWTWRGRSATPLPLGEFLLRGGGWAFYFFTVILLLAPLARFAGTLSVRVAAWIALCCLLVNFGLLLELRHLDFLWTRLEIYWWPAAFISTPFLARVLSGSRDGLVPRQCLGWLCVAYLVGAGIEWGVRAPDSLAGTVRIFLPEYLRIAPMVGAALATALAIGIQRRPPVWVSFLARNALGIFCLHCFVLRRVVDTVVSLTGLEFKWASLLAWPVVLFAMAAAAEVARRLLRERLI